MEVPDLKDQLRTYYESTSEPIDIDGFMESLLDDDTKSAEVIVGPFGTRTRSPMPEPSPTPWYRSSIGITAAVLTIIAIGVIAFTVASGPDDEVADKPSEVTAPSTTVAAIGFTEAGALAVVEEYFAAYGRGDVDAMTALFDDGATIQTGAGAMSIGEWTNLYHWKIAEGTELSDPECRVLRVEEFVAIGCDYEHRENIAIQSGGPAVPHGMTLRIDSTGIILIRDLSGQPDFSETSVHFNNWMRVFYPDDLALVDCCEWDSVSEAELKGATTARYAELWGEYLEENGCPYDVPCVDAEQAVDVVTSYFNAYDDADHAGMRALFAPEPTLADAFGQATSVERLIELSAWDDAQGTHFSDLSCSVQRQTLDGAEVVCELADQQFLREAVGAPPVLWTHRAVVGPDLRIGSLREFIRQPDYTAVNSAFRAWVQENHPEVERMIEIGWADIEEAMAFGETRRQYAELWAAYLDENGCTWDEPCEP
jgi:hypothetical protein